MATISVCKIDGCDKRVYGWGWCSAHYYRWKRHGDPTAGGTPLGAPEKFLRECVIGYQGTDCLIWPYFRSDYGYGQIARNGKPRKVHRIVCEMVHGAPPTNRHEAAHSCGNGHNACVNPLHVSWKTHIENEADKISHGTVNRGERNGQAKLTSATVLAILAARGTGTQRAIAERFGISRTCVSLIHSRQRWSFLDAGE